MTMNTTTRLNVKSAGKHHISGLFIFLLIAAYAVFSLLLVLIGVQAYRSVVQTSDVNGQVRTSISYVANKIRTSDGAVKVKQMDGVSVLTIRQATEDDDEGEYETRIYFLPDEGGVNGALYEQVVGKEEPFDPELGDLICEIRQFDIEQADGMVRLNLSTKNGENHKLDMRLRAENL